MAGKLGEMEIFLAKPETKKQKAGKYYDGHKSSVPPSLN